MNIENLWSQYRSGIKAFLHTVKDEASVRAWLFQVANNAIVDFCRKQRVG